MKEGEQEDGEEGLCRRKLRDEDEEEEQGEPVAKRYHMVSGTLALLYTVFQL